LKGILYFPQVNKQQVQLEKGQVKLYCNQVFIADNIKEVIPEFLMLLNGVIDCPDIPLNVSRSFLQNDKQVQKISKHITKKVADRLTDLFNAERNRFEECWGDISTFVKFGCIRDEDFYDKVKEIIIFKNLAGEYKPLADYVREENAESETVQPVYYASDLSQQAQYVAMFQDAGMDAMLADTMIDAHFMSFIEYKEPKKYRFVRIDADIDGALKGGEIGQEEQKELVDLFKELLKNKDVAVKVERFKTAKIPALINVDEFMRRMSEMQGMYGVETMDPMKNATLVLNVGNPVVSGLLKADKSKQEKLVNQIYYLAMISYKKLSSEELADFVATSTEILFDYAK
jgi:molecular chaperone HtpG